MAPSDHSDDAEKGLAEIVDPPVTIVELPRTRSSSRSGTIPAGATEKSPSLDPVQLCKPVPPTPKKPSPAKARNDVGRWIKFQLWFNTYRKFFTIVMTINLTAILLAAINVWSYPRHYTSAFVLGNLQAAILVRNELFGRLLYLVINTLFAKWPPLWFRLGCTSVLQHLGGIHSGCATSGCLWLIFRLTLIFIDHKVYPDALLVAGVCTNVAIAISILSAFPWVRNTHHNVFERHHRFVGWVGLLCTWVFVILGDSYNITTHAWELDGASLLRQQDLWFIFLMTIFTLWPWLTIRKVKVEIEIPSPKAVVLRFERGMQQGLLARISRSSILEYHAFGIISEGRNSGSHYLICGVQGDFTKSLVQSPPTHIWTRELKFAGVSNTSTLYKRGIRVCTGTGLGAALSTCLQSPNWYLIWIGSDQEKTFGPTISGLIHDNLGPERLTLWDSKKRGGRPDVMKLVKEAYAKWDAEVVFITSNYQGNQEIMEGCKEAGIPAFGTLWDF